MNRCILKSNHGLGARVFYYRYNEPEEGVYDFSSIWIYSDENLTKMLFGCHVSQIVKIDESHKTDESGYLVASAFLDVRDEWKKDI